MTIITLLLTSPLTAHLPATLSLLPALHYLYAFEGDDLSKWRRTAGTQKENIVLSIVKTCQFDASIWCWMMDAGMHWDLDAIMIC